MRYSLEPNNRRYVRGYGFLSLAKNFRSKYGKKLINSAKTFSKSKYGKTLKKEGLKFAKTSGKQIIKRTEESTGDLIGNKIADKISLLSGKQQEDVPQEEQEQELIIPLEKRQRIIDDDLGLFENINIKMECEIIINLLGNTSDNQLPR